MTTQTKMSPAALAAIEKVKKLLALATGNANEHEAEAAMAAAQRMLEAHNLDMSTLASTKRGSDRKDQQQKGGLYQWQRTLWEHVAKLNFCQYWSIKGTAKGSTYEHRILGRQENVIGTEIMAGYLQQTIERIAQEWAKQAGKNVFCKDAIAYREGMAARVALRLQEKRWQREADDRYAKEQERAARAARGEADTTNALTISEVASSEADLNRDYLNGWEPGTTAKIRAENVARWAAQKAADEEFLRLNPEEALKRKQEEQARNARWAKQDAEREKRRQKSGYYDRDRSSRKDQPRNATFYDGYARGAEIGLDDQIDQKASKAIA